MKETIETRTIVEMDAKEKNPILESCIVLEHMRDMAKDDNLKILCNDTLNALCRFSKLINDGFLVNNQDKLRASDLVNKVIENIEVTGNDVYMTTTDGLTFTYYASDGGYSSWSVERKGKENE